MKASARGIAEIIKDLRELPLDGAGSLPPPPPNLPPYRASGSGGGMADEWKQSVDAQLGQLHQDVRNLLGGILASFVLLAGGGWVVYDKLNDRAAAVQLEQVRLSERADVVKNDLVSIRSTLEKIDGKLDEQPNQ